MSVSATAAARPGPRPGSSRQQIVQCAIRMLDREGPEALSFRAVARELGIAVGALSRYFKNLADLEDEVAAALISEMRPLSGKGSLRQQLLSLSLDLLEINRAHPYLPMIHGPASAAVVARHTRDSLKVLLAAGIEFDRAMAIYALVANLPFAWGVQGAQRARHSESEVNARVGQVWIQELGEFGPKLEKILGADSGADIYRRWLLIYIDALLAAPSASGKTR